MNTMSDTYNPMLEEMRELILAAELELSEADFRTFLDFTLIEVEKYDRE